MTFVPIDQNPSGYALLAAAPIALLFFIWAIRRAVQPSTTSQPSDRAMLIYDAMGIGMLVVGITVWGVTQNIGLGVLAFLVSWIGYRIFRHKRIMT